MEEVKQNIVLKCCVCQKEIFIFSYKFYQKGFYFNRYVCYRCAGGDKVYGLNKLEKNRKEYERALMFVDKIE